MPLANYNQQTAAFNTVRKIVDDAGYGHFVSDDHCRELSSAVAEAVLAASPPPPPHPSK
jgi:hypothetical protein